MRRLDRKRTFRTGSGPSSDGDAVAKGDKFFGDGETDASVAAGNQNCARSGHEEQA
jgi:hypothetical protein